MKVHNITDLILGTERTLPVPLSPEATKARLEEVAALYARFLRGMDRPKIGDLVMPRATAIISGHGRPHVVIDTRQVPTEPDPRNLMKLDVRIAYIQEQDESTINSVWVESWWLEPYVAKDARLAGEMVGSA